MQTIFDAQTDFGSDADGLFQQTRQEIDTSLLDHLKAKYDASATTRMGENHHIAAIPVAVVEKWARDGFDILKDRNITARMIVTRLRAEHLDAFLATKRRV